MQIRCVRPAASRSVLAFFPVRRFLFETRFRLVATLIN